MTILNYVRLFFTQHERGLAYEIKEWIKSHPETPSNFQIKSALAELKMMGEVKSVSAALNTSTHIYMRTEFLQPAQEGKRPRAPRSVDHEQKPTPEGVLMLQKMITEKQVRI